MKVARPFLLGFILMVLSTGCRGDSEPKAVDWAKLCGGVFERFTEKEKPGEGFLNRSIRKKNVETSGSYQTDGSAGARLLASPRAPVQTCELRSRIDLSESFETHFKWTHASDLTPMTEVRKKAGVDVLAVGDYAELRIPKNTLESVEIYVKCDRDDIKSRYGMNVVHGTLQNQLFPELVDGAREVMVKMTRLVLSDMGCANNVKLNSVYSGKVNWA